MGGGFASSTAAQFEASEASVCDSRVIVFISSDGTEAKKKKKNPQDCSVF